MREKSNKGTWLVVSPNLFGESPYPVPCHGQISAPKSKSLRDQLLLQREEVSEIGLPDDTALPLGNDYRYRCRRLYRKCVCS